MPLRVEQPDQLEGVIDDGAKALLGVAQRTFGLARAFAQRALAIGDVAQDQRAPEIVTAAVAQRGHLDVEQARRAVADLDLGSLPRGYLQLASARACRRMPRPAPASARRSARPACRSRRPA